MAFSDSPTVLHAWGLALLYLKLTLMQTPLPTSWIGSCALLLWSLHLDLPRDKEMVRFDQRYWNPCISHRSKRDTKISRTGMWSGQLSFRHEADMR